MKGFGLIAVCGNVGDPINFGRVSTNQEEACSFALAIEDRDGSRPVWVRVNVYGPAVALCRKHLVKGRSIALSAKLMNRDWKLARSNETVQLVELRAEHIVFGETL